MEDEKIVALYQARQEAAIVCTAEKYGGRLRSLSLHIVEDRETAEECENDTYWEAWNRIPPHDPKGYLYAFLARITRHISLNCCRDRSRLKRQAFILELTGEMEQCIPDGEDTQSQAEARELGEILDDFVRQLPEEKRNVFLRRYWYLDSIPQIAQQFWMTPGAVRTMLSRIRKELRERLQKEAYVL